MLSLGLRSTLQYWHQALVLLVRSSSRKN
jgi:hypothetical protein